MSRTFLEGESERPGSLSVAMGESLAAALDEYYGLDNVTVVIAMNDTGEATTFKIESPKGEFCLKIYPDGFPLERLYLMEGILLALEESRFDLTPRIVRGRSGELHVSCNGILLALHHFIPADVTFDWMNASWGRTHCRAAGMGLARLHSSSRGVISRVRRHLSEKEGDAGAVMDSLLPRLHSKLSVNVDRAPSIWLCGGPDDHLRSSAISSSFLGSQLRTVLSDIEEIEASTRMDPVMVHGDYHPGNLLFQSEKLCGIIDFEYAHLEAPLYDLGYALVMFCAKWSDGDDDGVIDPVLANGLLEGYLGAGQRLLYRVPWELDKLPFGGSRLLLPYMRLACFLILDWLIEGHQRSSREVMERSDELVRHCLNILDRLRIY